MELLLIPVALIVVLFGVGVIVDAKAWDKADHYNRIRKSINNDFMVTHNDQWRVDAQMRG